MEHDNYLKLEDFIKYAWIIYTDVNDSIFIVDRRYEIIKANENFINIFCQNNLPASVGKKCYCLFDNEFVCNNCSAKDVFDEGIFSQDKMIRNEINGEKIIFKESSFPLTDNDHVVSYALVFLKDCTHETFLEDRLKNSDRLIEIGKLAAGIAHEIRNPLGNITAAAQFYLNKPNLDNEIKKYLKIIIRNSDRMNKVIKDLLNFVKPSEAVFAICSVYKIIDNVCRLTRARLLKQQVQLIIRFSRRHPKILLNEKLMEDVFLNLILNAIEAMPQGGKLTITAHTEHNGSEIVININDTGVGIPEDNLNKIFDPFFTTKKDGTGLGLSLVRQNIALHNGRIDIKSKIDVGTEIKIILPVNKEEILSWKKY